MEQSVQIMFFQVSDISDLFVRVSYNKLLFWFYVLKTIFLFVQFEYKKKRL